MGVLNNKVAVITGSSRGIGLAVAQALAQEGASVVIAARSLEAVQKAVSTVIDQGGQASGIPCDVSQLEQVIALREHALKTFGRLDIWINNAAISGPYGPTLGVDPEEYHRVVQTNILGVYHGSRVAMQHFLSQHTGKLINMIGAGASSPTPFQSAYGSSKAWVKSFTLALAKETSNTGVSVFAFQPGMVTTDLLLDIRVITGNEDRLRSFPKVIFVLARPPEEPAKKMVWVVSPATDGKTGKIFRMPFFWHSLSGLLKLVFRRGPLPEVNQTSVPSWEDQ